MNTFWMGKFRLQEVNMIVPDGAKRWTVYDRRGCVVFVGRSKREAVAWANKEALQ